MPPKNVGILDCGGGWLICPGFCLTLRWRGLTIRCEFCACALLLIRLTFMGCFGQLESGVWVWVKLQCPCHWGERLQGCLAGRERIAPLMTLPPLTGGTTTSGAAWRRLSPKGGCAPAEECGDDVFVAGKGVEGGPKSRKVFGSFVGLDVSMGINSNLKGTLPQVRLLKSVSQDGSSIWKSGKGQFFFSQTKMLYLNISRAQNHRPWVWLVLLRLSIPGAQQWISRRKLLRKGREDGLFWKQLGGCWKIQGYPIHRAVDNLQTT